MRLDPRVIMCYLEVLRSENKLQRQECLLAGGSTGVAYRLNYLSMSCSVAGLMAAA